METPVPAPNTYVVLDHATGARKKGSDLKIALPEFLLLFLVLIYSDCKKTNSDINQRQGSPTITGVKPLSAKMGDTIMIIGTNFNLNPSMDTIKLNGIVAQVQKATSDTLYVIVPPGNCSGTVSVNGIASTGPQFIESGGPLTITGIKPLTAKPGDTIVITGANFNLNPALDTVKFNWITAQIIKAKTDTLFVIVPKGNTSGVVTVNGISAPGPLFKVIQTGISILVVTPNWGKQGDTILIIGTNFNPDPVKDTVMIHGVMALVLKASADTLYVVVPPTSTGGILVNGVSAPAPDFIYGASVIVTTVAGRIPIVYGGSVDGPDSLAVFSETTGLCFDKQGNLYISEHLGRCVRKISAGFVSTFLGTQEGASVTDSLLLPLDGIAINAQGDMYITEGGAALDLVEYYGYHSRLTSPMF